MAQTLQETRRKYYAKNKEKIVAKSAQYYLENKNKVLKRFVESYKANPHPKRASAKKYAEDNPEKIKVYSKTWLEKHPDKRKELVRNSAIRAYGISPETYYEMLEKQGQRCAICRRESKRRAMNIDHNHNTYFRVGLSDQCFRNKQ